MRDDFESALREHAPGFHGAVRQNVPLKPFTHLRIGGPADWLVEPYDASDVQSIVRVCRELDQRLLVLGGGSNVLVSDEGVDAVVMRLDRMHQLVREDSRITAGAGATLPGLLRSTRELGLAGLEVLTGVPAEVGGAVAMNAGTHEGSTFDHLVKLEVVDSSGELKLLEKEDFNPTYRNGGLGDQIVVSATFDLKNDSPQAIYARFEQSLKRRNATQPVTERSVGCVFKNPDGDSAGRLIERAGCKTKSRGAVSVSGKHANYFVHDGAGNSEDFLALAQDVRERVQKEFGVELEFEVKRWGRGDAWA
ncbi:MAG: UDP-N-acetylmuramate dehydrogenase [Planctomycetota bacterium]